MRRSTVFIVTLSRARENGTRRKRGLVRRSTFPGDCASNWKTPTRRSPGVVLKSMRTLHRPDGRQWNAERTRPPAHAANGGERGARVSHEVMADRPPSARSH
jgi:hypothetical protein